MTHPYICYRHGSVYYTTTILIFRLIWKNYVTLFFRWWNEWIFRVNVHKRLEIIPLVSIHNFNWLKSNMYLRRKEIWLKLKWTILCSNVDCDSVSSVIKKKKVILKPCSTMAGIMTHLLTAIRQTQICRLWYSNQFVYLLIISFYYI